MEPKKNVKPKDKSVENKSNFPLLNFNHIKRFSIVITTTLAVVLSLVAFGYWLDTKLDTKPWLLVTGLLISFPIAQIAVYKQIKRYTKKEFDRLDIKVKK